MSELIYTTSGFLIPKSDLYDVYEKNLSPLEQLFSRSVISSSETAVSEFYKKNEIYTSVQANRLYMAYINEPKNFDAFMEMVNFATEIFSQVTCREFFEAQFTSLHIAPMSLLMCKDILTKNFANHQQYAVIPPNTRFMIDNGMTPSKANQLKKDVFAKRDHYHEPLSWKSILTPMIQNEGPFITMFKHIFVDYY